MKGLALQVRKQVDKKEESESGSGGLKEAQLPLFLQGKAWVQKPFPGCIADIP